MYYYLLQDDGFNSPQRKKLFYRIKGLFDFLSKSKAKNTLCRPSYCIEMSNKELTQKEIDILLDRPFRKNTRLVCVLSDALLQGDKSIIYNDFVTKKYFPVYNANFTK